MKSKSTFSGKFKAVLTGPDGQVKQTLKKDNLVVDAGLVHIISRLKGTASAVMSHMALGSGTTAPAAGDTALGTELGRLALTSSDIIGPDNTSIEYVATFAPGVSTGAVTEAGVFNDDTAGTMLNRVTFAVMNKGADDTISVTWTFAAEAE